MTQIVRATGVRATAVAGALVGALLVASPASAQDGGGVKAKAKEVQAASGDAIVGIKAAVKMTMSFGGNEMPGQDQQLEMLGTVVDPSGLVVISEAALNPGGLLEGMMGGMMGGGEGLEMKSDVGDVKIVLKDGKELPARVVLRDKDLDLAFIAANEKGLKMTSVSLEGSKGAEALDDVIVLGRLGGHLNRTSAVAVGKVTAVVTKPRTFFACDGSASGTGFGAGCPVFDGSGATLGILLQRRAPMSGGGGFASLFSAIAPVCLPSEDVKEVATQALVEAAKPPKVETKPAEAPKAEEPKAPEMPPAPKPEDPK